MAKLVSVSGQEIVMASSEVDKNTMSDTITTLPVDKEGGSGDKSHQSDLNEHETDRHACCPESTTLPRLLWKIDTRLIPMLCGLYLLAFLDRINISNARSFHLERDLGMDPKSLQFSTAVVIFFVPYCLFEIPANIMLKKFKPHIWLSSCMFIFGLVTVCQGLVRSYAGLLATRFFLGMSETGIFSGCYYLIGMWYRREEAQKRYSFLFTSTTLAGAFAGLLGAAIGKLDTVRGYSGWRWIFILEGTLTSVVSAAMFFLMSDFPEDAKFLTAEERLFVKARLRAEQGDAALDRTVTIQDVKNLFKDFKTVIGGVMYLSLVVSAYSYAYFAPLIISTYGYSPIQTQLHSVPPWVAAAGVSMTIAFFSDRYRHRYGFAILAICISTTGYAMLLGVFPRIDPSYAALHFITSGTYSAMPILVCWFTMNLGGHHRRAIGTGWQIGFGNIGGIIAAFAFQAKDAPRFVPGYCIAISFMCLAAVSSTTYLALITIENRRRTKTQSLATAAVNAEDATLGDLDPRYRYQL